MPGIITPEFLADFEALCRKHRVIIFGADYHDGVLIEECDGPVKIEVRDEAIYITPDE